jgi:hypothetical protein
MFLADILPVDSFFNNQLVRTGDNDASVIFRNIHINFGRRLEVPDDFA